MSVRIRSDLDELPAYVAGRTVPGSIKLASNEVSGGPLPSVVDAITNAAHEVHRYPDMAATELVATLSERLEVPTERIAVGCGSVALCQQIVQATCGPGDEVVFPWRSFEAYPILTRVAGAEEVRVPLTGEHALDLEGMLAAITPATRVVFVCTPNNPTGTSLRGEELEDFLRRVPSEVVVVLDEAYREFVTDPEAPDGVELTRQWDNVVSMRTFSKAYGLAGLRVGYAVGNPEITTALRKVYIPFSVSAVAQRAAVASLGATAELERRCAEVAAERSRVRDALLELGYEVPPTQANFVWLPLGERSGAFDEHCAAAKVVVRAFGGSGVRITIGKREENDAMLSAAASFEG
ncbi:histidinol-phosphate transaminase [Actinopolyspora erythraea]|uniref:Aromatic amino acid aminotransferase n=1 Tax=Actinopolyspora erythraea TaxID=414996 RepID=A0A099DBB8_9ACTN|nr:histidinol-phosphate transaminase [Actinopolyspora erythraea]ASU77114.1 histidinol-phosphate transaminase [Actinopolyspora erythraea]KGI83196.1 aminotransferase [Actinopolyspora erythraea]